MINLRLRTPRRRFTAPLTALAVIAMAGVPATAASASPAGPAAGSTSAAASPALAAGTFGYLCLSNASNSCASLQPGTSGNAVLGSDPVYRILVSTSGYWEAEFRSAGYGVCLASTGLSVGVHASWQQCGANGTVWVLVPHANGAYLESRFALNRGTLLVLTANGTRAGTQLYVNSPYDPGSPYWQTWTFHPAAG